MFTTEHPSAPNGVKKLRISPLFSLEIELTKSTCQRYGSGDSLGGKRKRKHEPSCDLTRNKSHRR